MSVIFDHHLFFVFYIITVYGNAKKTGMQIRIKTSLLEGLEKY